MLTTIEMTPEYVHVIFVFFNLIIYLTTVL